MPRFVVPRNTFAKTACIVLFAAAGFALLSRPAIAAVDTQSTSFSFNHTGTVSTGLASLLATYTNTVTTSAPVISLPQFDPALGRLTKVTVAVNTTAATFFIAPTGLLSLVSGQTATRRLSYTVSSGTATATDFNEVTISGATLLTLLQIGGVDIGGAPLAKTSQFSAANTLAAFSGNGTVAINLTATNTLIVSTLLSLVNGAGIDGSGNYSGSVNISYDYIPWTVSGYVYRDSDRNGIKGPAENATGLALYAKLVPAANPGGPALRASAVDSLSGAYTLTAPAGAHRIVIDDNANLADVTPLQIASGWNATQTSTLMRDVYVAADLVDQNFGLVQATALTGRVFIDDGHLSGSANDGIANGGEPGQPGREIRLLDNGGLVLDATTSASDGSYRLFVPSTVANGAPLQVRLMGDSAFLTTGASPGNSGGSFARAQNAISLTFAGGGNYTGLNFGSVGVPAFSETGNRQTAAPSSTLLYRHRFVARSTGTVAFSTTRTTNVSTPPWTEAIYLDSNNNGQIDAGESVINSPLAITAGQALALIVKITAPSNLPVNTQLQSTLTADMAFTGASPPLNFTATAVDYADVLAAQTGSLTLTKSVDQSSAKPGATLVYTIVFTNLGTEPVKNVIVQDQTPPYTSYAASTVISLPASLTTPSVTAPAIGAKGNLRWTFQGELLPSASGTLQFSVVIDN